MRCGGELAIVLAAGAAVDLDFVWLAPAEDVAVVQTTDPRQHRSGGARTHGSVFTAFRCNPAAQRQRRSRPHQPACLQSCSGRRWSARRRWAT